MISALAVIGVHPQLRLLDSYTTNLWSLIGLRKRRSAYTGACLRVRRSSDNAEQDIGFSGWWVDEAALLSFIGANSGFVTTLYDQSGNGRHWTQTTAANQPRVVNAGVFDGVVYFDGSNDYLTSNASSSGANSGVTVHLEAALRSRGVAIVLEHGADYNGYRGFVLYDDTTVISGSIHNGTGGVYNVSNFTQVPMPQQHWCVRFDTTQGETAEVTAFVDGAQVVRFNSGSLVGGDTAGNLSAQAYRLGARQGSIAASPLNLTSLALYDTAQPTATINAIHAA